MPKFNATWHRGHKMPPNPTLDQRVRWHLAHARACACREIPATVRAELMQRGVSIPRRGAPR
jgi:hypothetical protein